MGGFLKHMLTTISASMQAEWVQAIQLIEDPSVYLEIPKELGSIPYLNQLLSPEILKPVLGQIPGLIGVRQGEQYLKSIIPFANFDPDANGLGDTIRFIMLESDPLINPDIACKDKKRTAAAVFHAGVKISDAVYQHNSEVGGVDWVVGFVLPGHITFNDGLFPTRDDHGRELNVKFKPPGIQGGTVYTVVWSPPLSSQVRTEEVKATRKHPKRTNRFTSINIRPLGSGQTRKIPVMYRIEDFDTG